MVKNPNYKQFKEGGFFNFVEEEHIIKALERIKGKYKDEGRSLLLFLFHTGCRPVEALETQAKYLTRKNGYLKFLLSTAKRGRARVIKLHLKTWPLLAELWEWRLKRYDEELLFPHYANYSVREVSITRKGKTYTYDLVSKTDKLRYYFKKWFDGVFEGGVCPYYLRHNRFSKLASNPRVTDRELKQLKGSRTDDSIRDYIHLSERSANKLAKIK